MSIEAKVVKCPRCGMGVWEPHLTSVGCPTCKILDRPEPPTLVV